MICCLGTLAIVRADDRPNTILFIADDISWNDFGCYGNPAARTPHVDRLARSGIHFTEAYLTASSCSPSRASIITGRYPHNSGKAAELHLEIAWNLPWFPALLRQAGYYTALSGKNHMDAAPSPNGQPERTAPFDLIDDGRVQGNRGGHGKWAEILVNRPKDKPFFFWFASYDAHRVWDGDHEWVSSRYDPPHRPSDVIVPPFLADDAETRSDLASYYNEVTRFDHYVGQVVQALTKQGVRDNTLLLVMADNGRPFPRAKTRLHDSGMKTPLIANWSKGIRPHGASCHSLVSAIDLAPTILELAGVEIPDTMQGVSMQPLFKNPSETIRRYAFSEHNWHDFEAHGRSVRGEGFLLVRNFRPQFPWQGALDSVLSPSYASLKTLRTLKKLTPAQSDVFLAPRPVLELYRTDNDPDQLHNLVCHGEYADVKRRLSRVLEHWMVDTSDSVPDNLSQNFYDWETGQKLDVTSFRGTTPGEDRDATRQNSPGPR